MSTLFADILRLCQLLIIPGLFMIYRYMKRQTETQRDIRDLKTYVLAICKKMDITCTLKDM